MRFGRNRYHLVTVCQQLLVTAVVAVIGFSAAGVTTLRIVSPGEIEQPDLAPAITTTEAFAEEEPVTPHVREVEIAPLRGSKPAGSAPAPGEDRGSAPETSAPTTAEPPVSARKPASTGAPDADPTADPEPGPEAGPGDGPGDGDAAVAERLRDQELAAVSEPTPVRGYATVGVTWKPGTVLAEDQITVQVRTRTDGVWSPWTTAAYHDEHGPDPGSDEDREVRPGTDAVVVGDVDEVQMRAETDDGRAPQDLELAVIDPGTGEMAEQPAAIDTAQLPGEAVDSGAPVEATEPAAVATGGDGDAIALAAMQNAPKPQIFSRAQWGANERLREKSSLHYGTIRTSFIHHTVNANNYTAAQVPALIRGIYAYHTQSRGWSDIGYNFLVDRFGRIWEGRYGGVNRPVVGAHTLGYNEYSFAMSAIGNFDIAQPPVKMVSAFAKLYAWKLSLYGIRADASGIRVNGRTLRAINGHRDVGQTACPGKYLYAKIPSIRTQARQIQNQSQWPDDPVEWPMVRVPAGTPLPTEAPLKAKPQGDIALPAYKSVAGTTWPDIFVKAQSGRIFVVPGQGMLGFKKPQVSAGPWRGKSIVAIAGDVTGDRRADVVAKGRGDQVLRVYPGLKRGKIASSPVASSTAFKAMNMITAASDFDGDGSDDLLARNRRTHELVLFRGRGAGEFADPVRLRKNWPFARTTTVGDLDRDGHADILAVRSDGAAVLFRGAGGTRPKTAFKGKRLVARFGEVSGLVAGGDANGDKIPDVLVRRPGGMATLYAGTADGGLGQEWGPWDFSGLSALSGVGSASGGFIALARTGRQLRTIYPNHRVNLARRLPSNLVAKPARGLLNVGDWTGDGNGDLIARMHGGDRLVLWPGKGNGKFGRARSLGNGWKPIKKLTPVGDVTGDGKPDLLGRKAGGPLTIFPGNGLKAFQAPVLAPASLRAFNQIGSEPWTAKSGSTPGRNGSLVLLGEPNATAAIRGANGGAVIGYDTFIPVGDFNGDRIGDVLVRETETGTLWLLPGKTSGGFGPRVWVANGFGGYQFIG